MHQPSPCRSVRPRWICTLALAALMGCGTKTPPPPTPTPEPPAASATPAPPKEPAPQKEDTAAKPPVIDGSSMESYDASLRAITEPMMPKEKEQFAMAMMFVMAGHPELKKLMTEQIAAKKIDRHALNENVRKVLDGKSAADILAMADQMAAENPDLKKALERGLETPAPRRADDQNPKALPPNP